MFFFFKQKTAYEMRISDWSSDVCSSDLYLRDGQAVRKFEELLGRGIEHDGGGAMGHLRHAHSAGHDRISRQFRIHASLMAGKVGNIPVNRKRRSHGAKQQNPWRRYRQRTITNG